MRKFTFFLSMLFAMTVMAQTGGYEVNYTGTKNSDRPLNFVKVESASYGSSSYNLTAAEKLQLYVDATETVTLKVGAGDVVTPSIGYGGSWMHAYVYVDANGDGTFTADVADDGYTPTGDLVSYSAYNADPDGSGLWRNSAGEQNGNNTVALYEMALGYYEYDHTELGTYTYDGITLTLNFPISSSSFTFTCSVNSTAMQMKESFQKIY